MFATKFPSLARGILFLLAAAGFRAPLADAAEDPDSIKTEPGLRLQVFALAETPRPPTQLEPGHSPNIDQTIAGLSALERPMWRNDAGDVLNDNIVATLDGWLRIRQPGPHRFRVHSHASITLRIGGRQPALIVDGPTYDGELDLEPGWQRFEMRMEVGAPSQRRARVEWMPPGAGDFAALPDEDLRAPAFHFRPTQPGFKRIVTGRDRPGLGLKLAGLHPGYRITNIRPNGMEMPVGGLAMLEDGRLVVARFDATKLRAPHPGPDPNGELWILGNPGASDAAEVVGHRIAGGLFEPSGVCVINGSIYVSQRSEVTRFDPDGSGGWSPATVAGGWETNDFHQITAGLLHRPGGRPGHPGWLYVARSPGLGRFRNPPGHGSVWQIDLSKPPGENIEWLTGGHRTPNGIGFGPEDEIFVIDNQGEWTPANELNHIRRGNFYGFYQRHDPPEAYAAPFQPPDPNDPAAVVSEAAVILPQDEIGNSPTQPLLFPPGTRFAGQMALPDMRYGGINRVYLEEIDGVWQGCAMRFTQGLEAGPNRIYFGPGGSLFVGGIGGRHASTWNWKNPEGKSTFQGLERLDPTDDPVFEIESMRAAPGGFDLHFTEAVARMALENPDAYHLMQWTYRATAAYGGPKVDEHELVVKSARAASDGRSVRLAVDGLKTGYVLRLRCDPVAVSGRAIWSGEVWYTMNRLP